MSTGSSDTCLLAASGNKYINLSYLCLTSIEERAINQNALPFSKIIVDKCSICAWFDKLAISAFNFTAENH